MKKNITRIMLLALSTVLTLSLVFGLAGCTAKGPDAYAAAESAWNAATTKKAVDEITVSAVMDLGNIGIVTLGVNIELTREYDGEDIDKFTGKIKSVSITGLEDILGNNTIRGIISGLLPEGTSIDSFVTNNAISLTNPAEGSISFDGTNYTLEGSISAFGGLIEASTADLTEPVSVSAATVDQTMEDFGIVIPFDLLVFYGYKSSEVTNENTVSFTGQAGLSFILTQVYALVDNLFDGNVQFDGEDIVVDAEIITMVTNICGGSSSTDINNYLFGTEGLVDLGEVALTVTYDSEKNFDKISGTHTMDVSITKAEINRILDFIDLGEMSATIGGVLVFLPSTISGDITVTFTTTYTY